MSEICLIPPSIERVIIVARNFKATCTEHGDFIKQEFGHHMTLVTRQLSDRLSKAEWKAVKERLAPDERKLLADALKGVYFPNEDEIRRWEAIGRGQQI